MVGSIDTYRVELEERDSGKKWEFESTAQMHIIHKTLSYLDESESNSFNFRLTGTLFGSSESVDILNFTCEHGMSKSSLIRILVTYSNSWETINNVIFDTAITKCGNSMVIKVTEQCRLMSLEPGSIVRVKMERSNTYDSADDLSKLFSRKQTYELDEYSMYVDEESREHYCRFIKDYHIVGKISLHDIRFDIMDLIIDHPTAVKTEDGNVILISIPYNNEGEEEYARAFAEAHGLEYDYVNQYSWYHRGYTQLVLFWPKGVELKITH